MLRLLSFLVEFEAKITMSLFIVVKFNDLANKMRLLNISSFQDTPEYSSNSKQNFGQDALDSSSYFQFLLFFFNPLETVPGTPTTIDITVTLMLHRFFFHFSGKVRVFVSLLAFFDFLSVLHQDGKFLWITSSFFLLFNTKPCLCLTGIKWSTCISKSQRILYVSLSGTDSGLWMYHLAVWSNFNFLHNSQGITLLTQLSNYFVLVCYIRLLCEESFRFCHHITYTCYYFASYQFLI